MPSYQRRGRPKLNREFIDKGTEALQQKRRALFKKGRPQEMPLTASLLGIFYAKGLITEPLYEAGRSFAEVAYLYEGCLGQPFRSRRSSLLLERAGYSEFFSERKERKRIKAWRHALEVLKQAGPSPYRTVMDVVFYEADLYTSGLPFSLMKRVGDLHLGLECLEAHFNRR
ncbi:hypothetical protein QPK87_30490 [Kamptonema cortianum]|nr:hypothetical protein [Geitlerinema splendidum]MDK3160854.1 hypothetical protein [Kamptonema cortianum]